MGKDSAISWTHHTHNPWWGCTRVSKACDSCYAETFAHRLGADLWGKDTERRFFGDKHWNQPVLWDAKARAKGRVERVFCASMADVFEDRRDLDVHRERLWNLIEVTPNLAWLLLTKRPEKIMGLVPAAWHGGFPSNVWVGATVEDQPYANIRVPVLARVPAAVRFLSVEPMLGPVDLSAWPGAVSWVIVGTESGAGARPMNLDWARNMRDQCANMGTAFFVKQIANPASAVHPFKSIDQFPDDLQIQNYPVDLPGGVRQLTVGSA